MSEKERYEALREAAFWYLRRRFSASDVQEHVRTFDADTKMLLEHGLFPLTCLLHCFLAVDGAQARPWLEELPEGRD